MIVHCKRKTEALSASYLNCNSFSSLYLLNITENSNSKIYDYFPKSSTIWNSRNHSSCYWVIWHSREAPVQGFVRWCQPESGGIRQMPKGNDIAQRHPAWRSLHGEMLCCQSRHGRKIYPQWARMYQYRSADYNPVVTSRKPETEDNTGSSNSIFRLFSLPVCS